LPGFIAAPVMLQPKRMTEKKLSQAKMMSNIVNVSGKLSLLNMLFSPVIS
jgi:hypothetical protein